MIATPKTRGKEIEIKHANELIPKVRQFIMENTEQYPMVCEIFVMM